MDKEKINKFLDTLEETVKSGVPESDQQFGVISSYADGDFEITISIR